MGSGVSGSFIMVVRYESVLHQAAAERLRHILGYGFSGLLPDFLLYFRKQDIYQTSLRQEYVDSDIVFLSPFAIRLRHGFKPPFYPCHCTTFPQRFLYGSPQGEIIIKLRHCGILRIYLIAGICTECGFIISVSAWERDRYSGKCRSST